MRTSGSVTKASGVAPPLQNAGPAPLSVTDSMVSSGLQDRVEQRLANLRAERIAAFGNVEHDRQPPAVPRDEDGFRGRLPQPGRSGRPPLAEPPRELRPAEQ
jgi:hypothetical protein